MRSAEQVAEVHGLARLGKSVDEISRRLGIPRSTVFRWIRGAVPKASQPPRLADLPPEEFSYLFGLYLGDGSIARHPRGVYRLEIALDSRYPGIVDSCARALTRVMPENKTSRRHHPHENLVTVRSYSKWWPVLFPQHAPGLKHHRPILLDPWQGRLLDGHFEALLRGLIHSDGCRVINRVKNGRYTYPRYQFSNRSADIRAIFSGACDELGIHWTQSNRWVVSVSRRPDVARLDEFIGPKA